MTPASPITIRPRRPRLAWLLAFPLLASMIFAGAPDAAAAPAPYSFSFASLGSPATPTPWDGGPSWDILVHSRESFNTPVGTDGGLAQHGSDCSPYPSTHPVQSLADTVFVCHNHLMTFQNGENSSGVGYAVTYLTPDAMPDWSGGTATVDWSVSTLRTSGADWWDLWITPFSENLTAPLNPSFPDLDGWPMDSVHVEMSADSSSGKSHFNLDEVVHGTRYDLAGTGAYMEDALPSGTSATTRSPFQLQLSSSHVKLVMPGTTGVLIDQTLPVPLPFTSGVMQVGHHSYTPIKDCLGYAPCVADTWHWGGFNMSSATRFAMDKGDRRVVNASTPSTVNFAPAPAGAFLRFHALGTIEYSLDGGGSWQHPAVQRSTDPNSGRFQSYWQPVPQGTQRVMFRGTPPAGVTYPWWLLDPSIWSLNAGSTPTPTPTPTATPTPTPTATPTPTPTATPTPTPTATPTPTPTTTPAPASLVASSGADRVSGPAPLPVNFNGSASGGTAPYSYAWTFGDGTGSSGQSPAHIYGSAGSYTAVLKVTDGTGAVASSPPLSITATGGPSKSVLYSDTFEQSLATGQPYGWTQDRGTWEVWNDGRAVLSDNDPNTPALASVGSSAWKDYTLAADVRPADGTEQGLAVRLQNPANYAVCRMRDYSTVELGKYVNGTFTSLRTAALDYYSGTWYRVSVQVSGSSLTCSVDGTPLLSAADSTFATGRIGVEAVGAGEFSHLLVTAP